ncbi:ApeA N-terminal domain 1-containing protein [Subtercola endophyticus]|uniref:ApeA N-terminal domain 1-containing protein n=1 Tax=Subtercola endophyticus TaxID=2895559 RepID=UPI001E387B93|nr:HEPN domain-containing protein [Subtercola endophyticus]UFS58709.1 hypothetical protein LQ955_17195 [Subtercola endophyticus]
MQRLYGLWWEPGSNDKVPGVLTVHDDGGGELELVGGFVLREFEEPVPGITTWPNKRRDTPVLLGDADGKRITLVNCIPTLTRGGLGDTPTFQRFLSDQVLIGAWLEARDEPAFRDAYIRLENLTAWSALKSLSYTVDRSKENGSTATIRPSEEESVEVDGWKYTLSMSERGFRYMRTRQTTTVSGDVTARVVVQPPDGTSMMEINHRVHELSDLLTLATGKPSGLISLTLTHMEADEWTEPRGSDTTIHKLPIPVEVFGRRIYDASPDEPAHPTHEFRFTLDDMPFAELMPRWLKIRRESPAACNVYFGSEYAPATYTEMRLFSMAVSAEALHRSSFGEKGADASDSFVTEARSIIKKSFEKGPLREWVLQRTQPGATFKERMHYLAAVPDAQAVATLIPDIPDWARKLTAARNGVAHNAGEKITPEANRLFAQTRNLIALVMMSRLGLPAATQLRAATETML